MNDHQKPRKIGPKDAQAEHARQPDPSPDKYAKEEEKGWDLLSETLRQTTSKFVRIMGWVGISLGIMLGAVIFVYLLHLILPDCDSYQSYCRWLPSDRIEIIEEKLFAGGFGAALALFIERWWNQAKQQRGA